MPFYYFVTITEPDKRYRHQSGLVELHEYHVVEGDRIEAGSPLATVENWWARFEIAAIGPGIVLKTFFSPGTHVKVGDPILIVGCDGENAPAGATVSTMVVRHEKRVRPAQSDA